MSRQIPWRMFAGLSITGSIAGYYFSPLSILRYATEHDLPVRGTLEAAEYSSDIEKDLNKLPLVQKLESDARYTQVRAWEHIQDRSKLEKIFTAGTLNTPGGFSISPLVFIDQEEKSTVAIVHLGRLLTGFPLIIHGGVLGTLLDEALSRAASLNFDVSKGTPSNFSLNYKAPTLAHQFLVIKTWTERGDDNQAIISGSIQTTQGKELVQGRGTFFK